MRIATLVQHPREVGAVAAAGATEIIVPLAHSPCVDPAPQGFVDRAQEAGVEVWFLVSDDRERPLDHEAWRSAEGIALLRRPRLGFLCRTSASVQEIRRLAPDARFALGPWRPRGSGGAPVPDELFADHVTRVWTGRWTTLEEADVIVRRLRAAGREVMLPLPPAHRVRQWEDQAHSRELLASLFARRETSWAVATSRSMTLEERCGELLELKNLAASQPAQWTSGEPHPYRRVEGFPLVYADLLRHQPLLSPLPEELGPRLGLDGRSEWRHEPPALSAYVHVPVCFKRCRFCFCVARGMGGVEPKTLGRLVGALCAEMVIWGRSPLIASRRFSGLYIGGGSPTALNAAQLGELIAGARRCLSFVDDPVVSVEMAPSSISRRKLEAVRTAGANRISVGIQSFDRRTLERLGSAHDGARAAKSLVLTRAAGFEDIDIDLIYGVPGQTLEDLEADLERADRAGVSSVMLFPLHVTPGLLSWWADGDIEITAWTPERYHDFWERADRCLTAAGFRRFGYSHYKRSIGADASLAPEPSRYRYVMPGSDGQLSFGPAAIGGVANRQYENVRDLETYVERLEGGALPVGRMTDRPDPWSELVWNVIEETAAPGRISRELLRGRFGLEPTQRLAALIAPLVDRGLFQWDEDVLATTHLGAMWMANVELEILHRAGLPAPVGRRFEGDR